MHPRAFALSAALLVATGAAAVAQPAPATSAPAALPGLPAGIENSPLVRSLLDAINGMLQTTNGNAAAGKVSFFRRFDLQIETAPRVFRSIHLHQGTVIDPRGTTLAPGMNVTIHGVAQPDGSLNADTITVR